MKAKKSLLILGAAILSFGAISFLLPRNNNEKAEASYTNGDAATYYNGISETATGSSLLSSLQTLQSNRIKSRVGYNSMPSTYTQTDPGTSSGTVMAFYNGTSKAYSGNMNREHVWPASRTVLGRDKDPLEDDIHMTRPTLTSDNSDRGNAFFSLTGAGWDPAACGNESYRGDSARIIFYCVVADSQLSIIDKDTDSQSNHTMGKLSDLLKWNIDYPVKERENVRNEAAEALQGNRNPFIDHPEYACRIWGDTNATTKAICANASYPSVAHTAGIRSDDGYNISSENVTSYSLNIDDSVNFLPYVDGVYNAGVSWSLSDTTVASQTYYGRSSYTNGVTITGLKAGTTTLTLSYSYDDNGTQKTATASCLITVGESSSGSATNVVDITSATYTISSTSAVSTSGTVPFGSSATYSQTYSTAGQVTKSNNAVLTLSGYTGKVITGITLYMHSNGSKGAGSFTATAGNNSIASTSGEFNTWYDNTSYGTNDRNVNVTLTDSTHIIGSNEDITLTVTGTTNSLYLKSYTITYGTPGEPSEVTLSSIAASEMTTEYNVGDTFSFDGDLTATYSDDSTKEVTPTSVSSPDMSTAGTKTVTISYTEGGVTKTTTYDITVSAVVVPVTGVTLNKTSTSIEEGSSETLTATVLPSNATNKNVTWSTSNSEVATVNNGTVTAVKAGTATITVTTEDGSKTDSCVVTITEKVIPTPTGDYSLTDKSPYINGVPYKMYFSNASNTYYFNGEKTSNTYYGDTTTVAERAIDVYFEESGNGQNIYFIKDNVRQYLNVVKSGNYFNFSFSTTKPEIKWLYVTNDSYSAITYSVEGVPYTFGNKKNTSYSTFASVNLNNNPDGYKVDFICINQDYASVYATVINSYITCDSTGENAPTFANSYTWSNFALVFSKFSNDVRDLYTGTSTNEDIKDFTARYDYIVAKYGYTNFLSRDVSPLASRFNLEVNSEDNSIIIIVVIASVTALAFTTLLIIKKKKHR